MNASFMKNFEKEVTRDKIDSCLIQHNEKLVFEYYRNKKMKERQHKIYSVTKSILSALVGIAIDQGYISHVNTPVSRYFPDSRKGLAGDEITIKHLLTMTSGLHWPGNAAMIPSKNWVKFVLSQPVEYKPGEERVYSCGSSHLISAVLQKTTGADTVTFAKKHLFTPLGITQYKWNSDSHGVAIGGFGLNMKTEDLLKIGILYMNKGKWKSKQIVSNEWVEESTAASFQMDKTFSYGYHWWLLTRDDQGSSIPKTFFALGKNGQYMFVVPSYKLTAVFTSDITDDSSRPIDYFKKYLLPYACANS
ncbi:serine hydrolase domain-containing protein [Oceanobacillus oncorhynchi]|uniref:serine hydrolase domain-containing protein n=1 Tax=Oceanobacillus oncorhynchi TaxID=545501 RepID=UPI0034D71DD9